eukprot:TRINITY_DN4627_c0_g1_i1.p1 TRINITY_DN4627_c0_g1~~TRINITY_DN4627_c0_g1_i1.p1  ORF type:complete len:342 (+),score=65.15 TRINITY_DN4627_c0_g1_i1:68-1093(+)
MAGGRARGRKSVIDEFKKQVNDALETALRDNTATPAHLNGAIGRALEKIPTVEKTMLQEKKGKWTVLRTTGEVATITMNLENEAYDEYTEYKEVKETIRRMRALLSMKNNARRNQLRAELKSDKFATKFLKEYAADPDAGLHDFKRKGPCSECRADLNDPRYKLGSRHHCRVEVPFRCTSCPSNWYSHKGRMRVFEKKNKTVRDVPENNAVEIPKVRMVKASEKKNKTFREVVGQNCKKCMHAGRPVMNSLVVRHVEDEDDSNSTLAPKKAHLASFCEGCQLYGCCYGSFVDLLTAVLAVAHRDRVTTGDAKPIKYKYTGGDEVCIGSLKIKLNLVMKKRE